jgi:hypothetical protein
MSPNHALDRTPKSTAANGIFRGGASQDER